MQLIKGSHCMLYLLASCYMHRGHVCKQHLHSFLSAYPCCICPCSTCLGTYGVWSGHVSCPSYCLEAWLRHEPRSDHAYFHNCSFQYLALPTKALSCSFSGSQLPCFPLFLYMQIVVCCSVPHRHAPPHGVSVRLCCSAYWRLNQDSGTSTWHFAIK